ncbi:MAG: type IV pilus secretin PilQ [Acidobacteriota bacterium]
MRSIANRMNRRGRLKSCITCCGLSLAILAVAWVVAPASAEALPTPTVQKRAAAAETGRSNAVEIQSLEIREGVPGTTLDVATNGAPVWTTYRSSEGQLVLELSNSVPSETVKDLALNEGLLDQIQVEVIESSGQPQTRLVITTRAEAEHAVIAEGTHLRVDFTPVVEFEAAEWESMPAEDEAPVEQVADQVIEEAVAIESDTADSSIDAEAADEMVAATAAATVAVDSMEPIAGPSGSPMGDIVASQLQSVSVTDYDGDTVIKIEGDGEFHYSTLSLRAPDRFVVDLMGVVNNAPEASIPVEGELIERIRIAQFKPYPEPISRVVVDLRESAEARLAPEVDGIALSFGTPSQSQLTTVEQTQPMAVETASVDTEDAESEVLAVQEYEVEAESDTQIESAEATPVATEVEWQVSEVEEVDSENEGMGADETGNVGSHELSSLASAVAAGTLEDEVEIDAPDQGEPLSEASEPSLEYYEPEAAPQIADATPPMMQDEFESQEVNPSGGSSGTAFQSQAVGATETEYYGEPMTMSLKDADIKDVLRSFAQISGLNVVTQPGVSGTVTVELTDVPWDQALEIILKTNGLGYQLEGNIMRVAPVSQLRAEAEEQQRLAAAQALSIPLSTTMKRISYAAATEIATILQAGGGASLMSQRGSVVVDRRTNTLIIKELPSFMDTVLAVIENLDVPEPQVMIEARIIETTKRFNQTLGIEWNFAGVSSAATGNTTGLVFPNNGTIDGGVNLLTGANNGFLDISLGNVLDTFTLDMTLQAAESEGLINILSAPKITTLNNEEASIQSGLQIPIQTVANNTVSVQYVNATLRLDVTPHVTAEGTVLMDINIQKREPQLAFAVVGATNAPIATKDARTRVIVRDGGTTVIGGIYKVTTDRGEDRVPGLANIPVLGYLFKNKRVDDENEELLIFITPKVIKL